MLPSGSSFSRAITGACGGFRSSAPRVSWTSPGRAAAKRTLASRCSFSTSAHRPRPATAGEQSSHNNGTYYSRVGSVAVLSGIVALLAYGASDSPMRLDWGDWGKKPEAPSYRTTISLLAPRDGESRMKQYEVSDEPLDASKLPREKAILTTAPHVPPPIKRKHPVLLEVPLSTTTKLAKVSPQYKYEQWTFNDSVPGPFIRARAGDVVELSLTNLDSTGNPHNIDSHAFTGPGGGAAVTTAEEGETKTARFQLLYPGLYVYHCAAAPPAVHIANGMYGLMYVQPKDEDLPPVDREYYVMQSEFYHEPPEILHETGRASDVVEFSYPNALHEEPNLVVFNGSTTALTLDKPLKARTGETVRIFFGNAGPNLTSSFHVIGSHFKNVWRDGDVISPPAHAIATLSVPPGGATITDLKMVVPGTYTLVDHALFRLDKGTVGYLNVAGRPRHDILDSTEPPEPCVGCKLHP